MQIKVGTDFSGIGSPEMALKLLGIDHKQVFACEIDKYARKSFEAIHGKPDTFYEDITKRNHSEVPQLDLYVAGFPCQAFSMAGKRKGFDDVRGTLFFNVADFIRINQPKCFILENVKGLLSHDNCNTFQTIKSLLSDNGGTVNSQIYIPYFLDGLGYHIYYKVLNTKDFGIPQNRERIFIVGFKDFREFYFPKPFTLELRLKDMLQDNPDYFKLIDGFNSFKNIKYVDNNICGTITQHQSRESITNGFKIQYCKKSNKVDDKYFLSKNALKSFEINEKIKVPSATSKGYEEAQDGDGINLGHLNSKTQRGRVSKKLSHTIDTTNSQAVVSNFKIRKLTPLECWRLQGFPDEAFFRAEKVNSDTQLYKQAGNSITVNVMMELLKKIFNI